MTVALELIGLRKSFGPTEIIRGVDLQIKKDELHAIIGPNGAGKSTLYNLISGMYKVSDGSIILNGDDITNKEPYEINRMGLSRSFQVTNIFPKMSVFENVRNGLLYQSGCKYSFWRFVDRRRDVTERTDEILQSTGLYQKRDVPVMLLPYADQRALEIGITIAGGADVILLDEPTSGMSRSETDRAVELIRSISKDKTVMVVEHDMGVVFDLAERISVLVYGEIIASDTPENIRCNQNVQEAYLETDSCAQE
ncbi:MAG: ABC transporter ATP-binding protein [Proteobacteria bacterium]|jgi:branched-chain amino acid transport system ATP-binding protein|nr:ABC transporter ATP-binding protein [Pseudomonadota bacterium]